MNKTFYNTLHIKKSLKIRIVCISLSALLLLSCPGNAVTNHISLQKNDGKLIVKLADKKTGADYPILYCAVFRRDNRKIKPADFFYFTDHYKDSLDILFEIDYTVLDSEIVEENLESYKQVVIDLSKFGLAEKQEYGMYVSSLRLSRIRNPVVFFEILDGILKIRE